MSALIRTALRTLAVVGAASTVVALSACSTPQASAPGITADEVHIGTHAPASGPARDAANATKAYFDFVNAKGGVNGRKIVYDIEDDGGTQSGAIAAVKKLVEKTGVYAVVGGTGTLTHGAVVDYLTKQSVPDLFVESGNAQWDDPKTHPWTFNFGTDDVVQAKVLATYAQDSMAASTKCLLTEDGDLGTAFISGLADTLGPSGLATSQRIAAGSDPSAQVAAMRASGCTVAFLAASEPTTIDVVKTSAALGWKPTWMVDAAGGDYTSLADDLGKDAPALLDGMISTSVVPWGTTSRWATQFKVVAEQYNPKSDYDFDAALGMSVGYTFVEALAKAGTNPSRADIVAALESGRVLGNGLMPITYSKTNHAAYTGASITKVSGGVQDYVGHTYLAAAGGSQAIEYVGKGIPFAGDGIPSSS